MPPKYIFFDPQKFLLSKINPIEVLTPDNCSGRDKVRSEDRGYGTFSQISYFWGNL